VAGNGREAVDKLFQGAIPPPYDVVLMDLQMPEMDGYQATTKIRSDTRLAGLPIVAMTAHATIEERQRCLASGMNDHVAKPIDPALLFETLGRFYRPPARPPSSPSSATGEDRGQGPRATTEDLPTLEGLDTKDGLGRVAGNRKLYLKLLRQFVEQQGAASAQISEALARGDTAVAERLAHTVKGVGGNLGARAVQGVAGTLEKAIATKTSAAELAPVLREFTTVLEDFVGRVRVALPDAPPGVAAAAPPPPLDPALAKQAVEEMVACLNNFDPAAVDCLEANRDVFRALLPGTAFSAFEEKVGAFAFAEALAPLQQSAREKGLLPT